MFINSDQLRGRIKSISDEVYKKSNGSIVFAEYIALPFFGQIILRFDLSDHAYNIDDLDHYEAFLYGIVKDEFLVDFMGEVYRKVGIDYQSLEDIFVKCLSFYDGEYSYKSVYAEKIETDAKYLLDLCGLSKSEPVWEIQVEEEVYLLLFGESNQKLGRYMEDDLTVNVFSANADACHGLAKAAFYSKHFNVSLARALLQVQENLSNS